MSIGVKKLFSGKGKIIIFFLMLLVVSPIKIIFLESQMNDNNSQFNLLDISPKLDFSTYLGGEDLDMGYGIATTTDGSIYITGDTQSDDFPTKNAYNSTFGGMDDVFISKFSASGSLLWSTFLGGSFIDIGVGIAVSSDGGCFVAGETASENFPTRNAYNDTFGGSVDIFIARFSAQGVLLWSTFFGGNGSECCTSIALSSDDTCFITGYTTSNNFPTTMNAYNNTFGGESDAFIAQFTDNGALLWSTFLGGNNLDISQSIAVSSDKSCFVTGETRSSDFPVLDAYCSTYYGSVDYGGDAFIAKFSFDGSLLWSTFLGGSWNEGGMSITVARDGSCYLIGYTDSSDFPVLNAYDENYNSGSETHTGDVFITKFLTNGTLKWSTFFGGNGGEIGLGIAITDDDRCYIVGVTSSTNLPTLYAFNTTLNGEYQDSFIAEFSANYSLLWSTYFGGTGDDYAWKVTVASDHLCYITGFTWSEDFPTKNSFDSSYNDDYEAFVMKISRTSPSQLSSKGFYFFFVLIPIIPIVIIVIYRKRK